MSEKKKLVEQVIAQLEQELKLLTEAARAAREAATHEESKAEDQYDTRGLESSYLAGAQAKRVEELQHMIGMFRVFPVRDFSGSEPSAIGALIEVEHSGKRFRYLLATQGGGISVKDGCGTIQVITPQAPLGEELIGKRVGDGLEVEVHGAVREYRVVGVS